MMHVEPANATLLHHPLGYGPSSSGPGATPRALLYPPNLTGPLRVGNRFALEMEQCSVMIRESNFWPVWRYESR
jgi:hypothetical protein